jgi:MOSC domain-containing protein YiiM
MNADGVVLSVNVGGVAQAFFEGPRTTTAIAKRPVARVAVSVSGMGGDEQADLLHHGGPDQAVYAYATEDLAWWSRELGREMPAAIFGENVSTRNVDVSGALIGEAWLLGTAVVQVTSPRIPCRNFAGWMGEAHWMKRFTQAERPGAYLRVIGDGHVGPGDPVEIVDRPDGSMTIAEALRAYYGDWDLLPRLLVAPGLAARWAEMARLRQASGTLLRLPDNPAPTAVAVERE